MNDDSALRLRESWRQCQLHLHHVKHALVAWAPFLPVMPAKLHRQESASYLSSVDEWNALQVIRNTFAHDYPQDDALKADYLNEEVEAIPVFDKLLTWILPVIERIR